MAALKVQDDLDPDSGDLRIEEAPLEQEEEEEEEEEEQEEGIYDSPTSSCYTRSSSANPILEEVLRHDYLAKIPGFNSRNVIKSLAVER